MEKDIPTEKQDTQPKTQTKKSSATSRKARRVVKETIQGRSFLSLEFFRRNAVFIVAATLMVLMYISNKYVRQNYVKELIELREDLENAKTDFVSASANYNSMIRESQMKQYIDTMRIDLVAPDQPPYHLTTNQTP